MVVNCTPTPPSSPAQPLSARVPCAQEVRSSFEISPLGCSLPFLTSTRLSTQTNSLTSPEFIWVMGSHGPSLPPAPGVTQLPDFSGFVTSRDLQTSQDKPSAVCLLLPLYPPQQFQASRSIPGQVCDLPTLEGEGTTKLQSLTLLS